MNRQESVYAKYDKDGNLEAIIKFDEPSRKPEVYITKQACAEEIANLMN